VGSKIIHGGDDRYYNNIFMSYNREAPWPDRMGSPREVNFFGLGAYDPEEFPMVTEGNVYIDKARAFAAEDNPVVNQGFLTHAELINKGDGIYLEIKMDKEWNERQRQFVTSELLGKAENPNLPFVQPGGKPYGLDTDYLGKERNTQNPSPGPFEEKKDGILIVKVWER